MCVCMSANFFFWFYLTASSYLLYVIIEMDKVYAVYIVLYNNMCLCVYLFIYVMEITQTKNENVGERARARGRKCEWVSEQHFARERMNENGTACRQKCWIYVYLYTYNVPKYIYYLLFYTYIKRGEAKRARDIQQETHNAQQYKMR